MKFKIYSICKEYKLTNKFYVYSTEEEQGTLLCYNAYLLCDNNNYGDDISVKIVRTLHDRIWKFKDIYRSFR